jgi:hypothetical protein
MAPKKRKRPTKPDDEVSKGMMDTILSKIGIGPGLLSMVRSISDMVEETGKNRWRIKTGKFTIDVKREA